MKRKNKILIILIAAVISAALILILVPRRMKDAGSPESADLDRYFEELAASGPAPGITAAVMKDGRIVYSRGFGTGDPDGLEPVGPDTIFPWWSVTKLFTAAAVLQLAERQLISLDDSINRYIPWFELTGKDGEAAGVTIKQLLNHQSGLKDFIPEGLSWIRPADSPPVNQTDFLRRRISGDYRKLDFAPGTKTHYTNTEYVVLSAVIEEVTGMSYEKYVEDNILEPLSLNDTCFVRTAEQQERTAGGSMKRPGFFPLMLRLFGPDGFYNDYIEAKTAGRYWMKPVYTDYTASTGLSGTTVDLAAFGNFLMSGRPSVLGDDMRSRMLDKPPLTELPGSYDGVGSYGMGVELWRIDGLRVFGHGGGGPGYGSLLAFIPERDLVIAFSANDTTIDRDEILRTLASAEW